MPNTPIALNSHFKVPGLTFEAGRGGGGGQTVARIRTELAECDVYLFGAHVTHYQPAGERPVLFLSDKAVFDGKTAIRGGIPICFPWFAGNGPTKKSPSHGFARTREWGLVDARREGEEIVLVLVLVSTENTRKMWPHEFVFTYTIRVGRSLCVEAKVTNVGDDPLRYELALHSYFDVTDVRKVALKGFAGCEYIDQLQSNAVTAQSGEPTIDGEVDRIYQNHTADVVITDGDRRINVSKTGGASTVLWNPHIAKAERMSDFGDEEWRKMLCIESGAIGENAVTLAPGKSHSMKVTVFLG